MVFTKVNLTEEDKSVGVSQSESLPREYARYSKYLIWRCSASDREDRPTIDELGENFSQMLEESIINSRP